MPYGITGLERVKGPYAHADAAFCRFHHYVYSQHLLLIKHQRSEAVFVCMHDALLLVCVCVLYKCSGVMVNNPLVLWNAEFNCSKDPFQFDVPWWITDIKYIYIYLWYYKKIYFHYRPQYYFKYCYKLMYSNQYITPSRQVHLKTSEDIQM